ncbi:MAG: Diacylglycerol O-acyltransferase [Chloroflexi bacterium]|nr:Diacylglycerol O-acyltransferase [Chloroflexota bacterium]
MNREPLSNADFALLRLDSPDNWMIVTALVTLETRLDAAQLKTVIERSMLVHKRFRQRVALPRTPLGKAYWETDESFNLDRHIVCVQTPLPEDQKLLEELVSRSMSVGLDFSRPLWRFYLVERYGNRSAVVMRFHHCLADGISMVRVLISMAQAKPDETLTGSAENPGQRSSSQNSQRSSRELQTQQILRKLAGTGRRVLSAPLALEDVFRLGASTASALGQLFLSAPEINNTFRGRVGIPKRAAWSPAISLEQVKFLGRAFDCTVNDILLSTVAGALRRYMLDPAPNSAPIDIHSFVPIDLRRGARVTKGELLLGNSFDQPMGNRFGFAVLELPVGIDDPIQRLHKIHQSMDALKASGEALVSYLVLNLMGSVPGKIQDLAVRFWMTKGSAVMTNVVGPSQQLYLGNAAIDTIMAWVPQSGRVGLGVSIFSYNGRIWLGVSTDQGLVNNPERIVENFLEELHLLGAQAMLRSRPLEDVLQLPPVSTSPPGAQTLDQTI